MSRALLDTDILSEVLKNRDDAVARAAADSSPATASSPSRSSASWRSRTACTEPGGRSISKRSRRRSRPPATSCHSTRKPPCWPERIEAHLEKVGTPIDAPDVMIAATAIGARLPLVTGNTAHFEAVTRASYPVTTENWRKPWSMFAGRGTLPIAWELDELIALKPKAVARPCGCCPRSARRRRYALRSTHGRMRSTARLPLVARRHAHQEVLGAAKSAQAHAADSMGSMRT
jgi:tRNA(fMet)-specific endonuclease VapC